jgi:hypothetical protein
MFAAYTQGIRVFATGGNVSADLTALARVTVAAVCAGAKAILDLPARGRCWSRSASPCSAVRSHRSCWNVSRHH